MWRNEVISHQKSFSKMNTFSSSSSSFCSTITTSKFQPQKQRLIAAPPLSKPPHFPPYTPKPISTTTTSTITTKATSNAAPVPTKPIQVLPHNKQLTRRRAETPSLATTVFNAFDNIINNFIDPPKHSFTDPKHLLADNFAPVDELSPTECSILEGKLPLSLNGAYIRNGPNPQHLPRGPYHAYEGDGMLHSIRISKGRATLCSRYVKTYKYTLERDVGSSVFLNLFSGFHGLTASVARGAVGAARILAGQYDPSKGTGPANTSLAFFADKLFALGESDLPYEVRLTPEGDIETIGRHDFDGKLVTNMTAHPKIDPNTGEVFAFRYSPVAPFLTLFRFDSSGSKQPDVPILSLEGPSMIHDLAITKKYVIFVETQLGLNPIEKILGGAPPIGSDPRKVSRIGVIRRHAKDDSEMKWFDVPGFNIFHTINAWDESEDSLVLVAPNILTMERALEKLELVQGLVEKVTINLNTGIVSRVPISARNLDFGVINPAYLGKKNRYAYAAVGNPWPNISGVVKLDLAEEEQKDCTVASRMYESGCYGSEPFFVAKEPENPDTDEDDGYVVTYMHNENTGESRFLVMDAKSPTLNTVASVKLPRRVPYGFHGLFVKDNQLKKKRHPIYKRHKDNDAGE